MNIEKIEKMIIVNNSAGELDDLKKRVKSIEDFLFPIMDEEGMTKEEAESFFDLGAL